MFKRNMLLEQKRVLYLIFLCYITSAKPDLVRDKNVFVFNHFFDQDGSGTLNLPDLQIYANKLKSCEPLAITEDVYRETLTTFEKMMKDIAEETGAKNVGYITLDQWVTIFEEFAKHPDIEKDWQKLYKNFVFNAFNSKRDGAISSEQFVAFLVCMGADKEEAKQAFEKLANGKKLITKEEFSLIWRQFHSSNDPNSKSNYLAGTVNFNI